MIARLKHQIFTRRGILFQPKRRGARLTRAVERTEPANNAVYAAHRQPTLDRERLRSCESQGILSWRRVFCRGRCTDGYDFDGSVDRAAGRSRCAPQVVYIAWADQLSSNVLEPLHRASLLAY